jgi:hypothetical protein
MPLSSVVGAQSIVRPGVCTSSTRPASPYDGQVIYETDTDKTLVWNGSAWVYLSTSTANPVGLELITTQTIGSAVSSVTVSNCFSSTYDNYKITITGGTTTAEMQLNMTLGSSTASYYSAGNYVDFSTGSAGTSNVNNGSAWGRIGYGTTSGTLVANLDVYGPYLSGVTYATALYSRNGNYFGTVTHLHNSTASYASFTVTTSTGTVTGGTIRVYGYKN